MPKLKDPIGGRNPLHRSRFRGGGIISPDPGFFGSLQTMACGHIFHILYRHVSPLYYQYSLPLATGFPQNGTYSSKAGPYDDLRSYRLDFYTGVPNPVSGCLGLEFDWNHLGINSLWNFIQDLPVQSAQMVLYYLLSIHGMAGCYRHFAHDSDPPSGRLGLDYHWRIILYTRSDHL